MGAVGTAIPPAPSRPIKVSPKVEAARAKSGLAPMTRSSGYSPEERMALAKREQTESKWKVQARKKEIAEGGGALSPEYTAKMKQVAEKHLTSQRPPVVASSGPVSPSISETPTGTMPAFQKRMTDEVMKDQAARRQAAAGAAGAAPPMQPAAPTQPAASAQGTQPAAPVQPAQQAPAKEYFPTFKAIGRGVKGVGKGLAIGTGLGGMYAVSEGIKGLREGEQQNR